MWIAWCISLFINCVETTPVCVDWSFICIPCLPRFWELLVHGFGPVCVVNWGVYRNMECIMMWSAFWCGVFYDVKCTVTFGKYCDVKCIVTSGVLSCNIFWYALLTLEIILACVGSILHTLSDDMRAGVVCILVWPSTHYMTWWLCILEIAPLCMELVRLMELVSLLVLSFYSLRYISHPNINIL